MTEDSLDKITTRAKDLKGEGLDSSHAFDAVVLEENIRNWPSAWGDNLCVLLYGDFQPPDYTLTYPSLRITVHFEKHTKTPIMGAMTVLKATVGIKEKSVDALIDAAKRINLLLGIYTLHKWNGSGCGWWSHLTHGGQGGVMDKFTHNGAMENSINTVLGHPIKVRKKLEAALYWLREPESLMAQKYRSDILRKYSAHWNTFECLVEVVNLLRPRKTLSDSEKQEQINNFMQDQDGTITAESIQKCYLNIINPGFVGKAEHALKVCFGDSDGEYYFQECFRIKPAKDRLYNIRNAINHGDIDTEDLHELMRIDAKLKRLWMINMKIFGLTISRSAPIDPKLPNK